MKCSWHRDVVKSPSMNPIRLAHFSQDGCGPYLAIRSMRSAMSIPVTLCPYLLEAQAINAATKFENPYPG